MRPLDTTEKAAAIWEQLNRMAGPERRFQQAMELSDLLHEFAKAGARDRHPEFSEAELMRYLTLQLHPEVRQHR